MQRRAGAKTVPHEANNLVLAWCLRDDPVSPALDFTISRPGYGTEGTQADPLVEGTVTLGRAQLATVGRIEIDESAERRALFAAIDDIVAIASKELT